MLEFSLCVLLRDDLRLIDGQQQYKNPENENKTDYSGDGSVIRGKPSTGTLINHWTPAYKASTKDAILPDGS